MPKGTVAVRVHMAFTKSDPQKINQSMVDNLQAEAQATSKVGFPNAGSIFKNPERIGLPGA